MCFFVFFSQQKFIFWSSGDSEVRGQDFIRFGVWHVLFAISLMFSYCIIMWGKHKEFPSVSSTTEKGSPHDLVNSLRFFLLLTVSSWALACNYDSAHHQAFSWLQFLNVAEIDYLLTDPVFCLATIQLALCVTFRLVFNYTPKSVP